MADHEANPSFEGDPPAAAEPDALPDRRELALVAVERTRMPMVVTDPQQPDNPIVLANQAFLDLTGYAAEEVIGRNCRFLQGEATAAADIDLIRQGLESDEHQIDVELLNYRKDGSAFLNQLVISPVHASDGKLLYHFASQKDVTERRRAEELEATERLLLMEVDHRAMNALALVQSIVRLSRTDSIPDYTASVLGRIDSLARAHRLLAATNWTSAELADLVNMETPATVIHRVKAEGPPAPLMPRLVQPITLILHELFSNAMKHGALAARGGAVVVNWKTEPARLTMTWQEAGAELSAADPTPGFGLTMVRGVVERQLDGLFTPQWQTDGMKATLEFPLIAA
jgi:PAS domain S-box-containing protein